MEKSFWSRGGALSNQSCAWISQVLHSGWELHYGLMGMRLGKMASSGVAATVGEGKAYGWRIEKIHEQERR